MILTEHYLTFVNDDNVLSVAIRYDVVPVVH